MSKDTAAGARQNGGLGILSKSMLRDPRKSKKIDSYQTTLAAVFESLPF